MHEAEQKVYGFVWQLLLNDPPKMVYRSTYRLDALDITDIERNLEEWEQSFLKVMGVSYDESDYRGKV